jgi:hypothetical protein
MPPEKLEDLKATIEGRPNSGDWEVVDQDEIAEQVMTDDAYGDLLVKLRKLFVEEQPPHEPALRAATHMAVGLAVAELGMDTPSAKAWFSKAVDEFVDKLEAHGQKHQN